MLSFYKDKQSMVNIPNLDTHSNEKPKRSLNDYLDEDYQMLVAGRTGSGKTNTVMYMLRKPLVYYDKIYLYTRNPHQDKVQDLKKVMAVVSQRVGCDVLEIKDPDDIMDTKVYPEGIRKIVIFDDLVNAPQNIQSKIANHFTDGRHNRISPIYLTQSYYDTPLKLRLNCSHMILYTPPTKNHCNLIAREQMIDPELFKSLGPYEFLFVDKEKKKVAKNFDEKI